jgi:RimJ/RimL family protein N-acetyltransferase
MVLANNPRVTRMTTLPHPYGLANAERWIARLATAAGAPDDCGFAIGLKRDRGAFIGSCGFGQDGDDPVMHFGYWLGEPYWGRGYASEAAREVLRHAFETLGLPALQATCNIDNPASRAVLTRLGFQHRCVGTEYVKARRRAEPVDTFLLTAKAWRERHDRRKAGVP